MVPKKGLAVGDDTRDAEQIDFAEIFKRRLDQRETHGRRDLAQHIEPGEGMRPGSSTLTPSRTFP